VHRRQRIEDKLLELATVFAIDLYTYSVMHNQYHVVLLIDKSKANSWDVLEVMELWHLLFSGTLYSQELLTAAGKTNLDASIVLWRERLMYISWLMRIINGGIARMANRDDDSTGRFWEGPFSIQLLFNEKTLAACSA
jgi:putative transposase